MRHWWLLRLCVLMLCVTLSGLTGGKAIAQSDVLFTPIPENPLADMTPAQAGYLRTLQEKPTTGTLQLVRVNLNVLQDSTTSIPLPELGTMRADRRKIEARSPSDFTWFGNMQVTGGAVILVVQNGEVTGTIRNGVDRYSLTPLGHGVHALIKVDQSKLPGDGIPLQDPDRRGGSSLPKQIGLPQPSLVTVEVDVLVPYTANARAAVSNIGAQIQLAVDEANQALVNSRADVSFRLVGTMEISYSDTGKATSTILNDLRAGTDPQMSLVHARRDSTGADVVLLVFNNTSNDNLCGQAALLATEANAYAVSDYTPGNCLTGNYTFVHEIGHLFGARHNIEDDGLNTPFPYGHGFRSCNIFRTVMAVFDPNCPRIQYFSNPNVTFNGTATGTATTAHNARVLNEQAATVAGFRTAAGSQRPTCALVANPSTINPGQSAILSWTSSNATSGTISPTVGSVGPSGSQAVSPSQTTTYTGTFTGAGGSGTCTATLTVNIGAPPNDNFANATTIQSGQTLAGTNVGATKQTGEPNHAGIVGGHSVWWKWTAGSSGPATIKTAGSNFDTLLAVYTGSAVNALSLVAQNDDAVPGSDLTSLVSFTAGAGATYFIAVDGFNAETGNITLNVAGSTGPSLVVSTTTHILASGKQGGPFSPSSFQFQLSATTGSLNFTITGLPSWLTASPASGSVSTSPTTVTFTINASANALTPSFYNAGINFNNTTNGLGSTSRPATIDVNSTAEPVCDISMQLGDLDGDHRADILWRRDDGLLALWRMNGATILSTPVIANIGPEWRIAGTGDFNGDGKSDILWRRADGFLAIWLMDNTTILSQAGLGVIGTEWRIAGIADFNGDGRKDILWRRSDGSLAMWLMNGTTPTSTQGFGFIDTGWSVFGVADFNGDGQADILWRRDTGELSMWFMNGTAIAATASLGVIGTDWRVFGVGDFNADGKNDLLWRRTDGFLAIWLMNGATAVSTPALGVIPLDWQIAGVGDTDGDAKADILWRSKDGAVALWRMNGGAIASTAALGNVGADWHSCQREPGAPAIVASQ